MNPRSRSRRRPSPTASCWRPSIGASRKNGAFAASWSDCVAYGRSIRNWPPFADTVAALAYLKRHYKLVILSNVDNESFAASNEKLKVAFDAIYTAEDCGSYKPSSRNFEYMLAKLETLGIKKRRILHTAESLFHDHAPANAHGLASCWILPPPRPGGIRRDHDPGPRASL